uniref:RILP-like protein 2 n=1 Tax=Corvus moneduloides TaxID=1196302 RepID=A0A8C3DHQ2_CORMO
MERGREGEEELEEEEEDEDGGPESALEKSPFQLTATDVYDISSVVGRDLLQLRAGPQLPAARARLQFRIVRVLEMLEALVSESSVAEEQLRRERDSLRRELEQLRRLQDPPLFILQPNLGPDQMVIDLTDPNRPRFTLQELRDVLQERNQLKAQLLVVQEELQCYKRPPAEGCVRPLNCAKQVISEKGLVFLEGKVSVSQRVGCGKGLGLGATNSFIPMALLPNFCPLSSGWIIISLGLEITS